MVSIVGNWWKHRFQNLLTKMCLQIRLAKVSFQQCSVFPLFHYNVMLHKGFITNKTSETQIKVSQTCFSGGWQCTDRMTHYKYHRFIAITKMAIFCPRGRGMLHQWSISCHHVSQRFIKVFTKQTWILSKILHCQIFRLKILHRQFHLILAVLVRKNTKNEWKWRNLHRWQKFYTAAGTDGMDKFHLCS